MQQPVGKSAHNFPNFQLMLKSCYMKKQWLILVFVVSLCFSKLLSRKLLVIGIFSARDHFEERTALRKTWLKSTFENSIINYYFILGNSTCHIPPEARRTPYGCDLLRAKTGPDVKVGYSTSIKNETRSNSCATGFGFRADDDLIITHVRIPKCVTSELFSPVRVKLLDAFDRKELVVVTFGALDDEEKEIRPILFPRGSEGILIVAFVNNSDANLCKCSELTWNEHGLVSFTSLFSENRNVLFNNNTKICVSMLYKPATELMTFFEKAAYEEQERWEKKLEQISEDIAKENDIFRDILFVNVTDYYYNLPNKLLSFIQHISLDEYEFMLKTDDDSFVDIPRVVAELREVKTENLWWWSTFKEYQQVPLVGKWRERKYASATYPPYPCGAGYIINRKIIHYISSVSEHLIAFQGEDVSIGIWLAGLDVETHKPAGGNMPSYRNIMLGLSEETCRWACNSEDQKNTCNLAQLSVLELYIKWKEYLKFGHIST